MGQISGQGSGKQARHAVKRLVADRAGTGPCNRGYGLSVGKASAPSSSRR